MMYVDAVYELGSADKSPKAREAFTKSLSKDLYEKRVAGVKGVACYNGPYAFSSGASYEGPVTVKFEWDMYNTE
jgi:hypothetical protein